VSAKELERIGQTLPGPGAFNAHELELIKDQICKGATDAELALFIQVAQKQRLNPFAKQIAPQWRWDKKAGRNVMTILTTIHGLRLIAERSGRYAPGPKATFETDAQGRLISATAYVKKHVQGEWHTVEDTAFWEEYVQLKDGQPIALWASKPRVMLAKCAEALALRRAFPAETEGLYTDDEVGAAPIEAEESKPRKRRTVQFRMEEPAALLPPEKLPDPTDELPPGFGGEVITTDMTPFERYMAEVGEAEKRSQIEHVMKRAESDLDEASYEKLREKAAPKWEELKG